MALPSFQAPQFGCRKRSGNSVRWEVGKVACSSSALTFRNHYTLLRSLCQVTPGHYDSVWRMVTRFGPVFTSHTRNKYVANSLLHGCPIHPNWVNLSKVETARLDSARFVSRLVDPAHWKSIWETLGKIRARTETRRAEKVGQSTQFKASVF